MWTITGGYDMNINFELYRIFYEVATIGNITKASQKLMISQPAVTKQIKALENQLGGELFIRTKRGVILTDNGKEIYNHIKQGMHCFEAAELQFSNLKKLETGIVRIGISTTLCRIFLLKYLEEFHKKYPNITIQIFTDPSKVMRNMLKDGTIDILIAKDADIEDDDLKLEKVGTLHQCFISSKDHYTELKDRIIPLQELDKYPLLLPKTPSTTRKIVNDFCKLHSIKLTSKLEVASANLLEDFVRIGLGVGLVTKEYAVKNIGVDEFFVVKTEPELPSVPFSLITLKNSYHSFGANRLIEMILEDRENQEF